MTVAFMAVNYVPLLPILALRVWVKENGT